MANMTNTIEFDVEEYFMDNAYMLLPGSEVEFQLSVENFVPYNESSEDF